MKMKTIALVGCLVVLTCFSCATYASFTDWNRVFGANCDLQQSLGMGALVGTNPTASDGYDSLESLIATERDVYVGTHHVNGEDGWLGPTGFYRADFLAPITMLPGQSKTWTIYVWAHPALPVTATYLGLDFGYNAGIPDGLSFALTLQSKPAGITGGPAVGTVWDLSALPGGVQLPVFRTANGLEGYVFDFTATVIPEPSSLLALCAGLVSAGAMWRGRRRQL